MGGLQTQDKQVKGWMWMVQRGGVVCGAMTEESENNANNLSALFDTRLSLRASTHLVLHLYHGSEASLGYCSDTDGTILMDNERYKGPNTNADAGGWMQFGTRASGVLFPR